jgi:hypothetical protein
VSRPKGPRGLQDIKTLAGKVGPDSSPSRAFLRIAVLEMEKERRGRERESVLRRMSNIEARFGEIEAEKATLLDAIGHPQRSKSRHSAEDPTLPAPQRQGVRVRY